MKRKLILTGAGLAFLVGLLQWLGKMYSPSLYDFMTGAAPWLCMAIGLACFLAGWKEEK